MWYSSDFSHINNSVTLWWKVALCGLRCLKCKYSSMQLSLLLVRSSVWTR